MRVSTLPTGPGERVVLRLLDKDSAQLDLTRARHERADASRDRPADPRAARHRARHRADGLRQDDDALRGAVAAAARHAQHDDGRGPDRVRARRRRRRRRSIRKIELDFARALRAILRQDPDIIMIGEIRDLETAQIAVQASLTGHLVLATLHTNDAASAVTRLADMGVEPYLLASSLLGVLAQRLVRTLCPACRATRRADRRRSGAARRARPAARDAAVDAGGLRAVQRHRLSRPHRRLRAHRRRRRAPAADPRPRAGARAARRRRSRTG